MANQIVNDKKEEKKDKTPIPPNPETLHTTDPQEEMEGPVSSFMQNLKHTAEANNKETKEEADKKRDENL